LAVIAGAAWGLAWAAPPPAEANEFMINACQADRAEFSTRAFEDFANRGMMWKRACDPEGPGLRGLVTANVVRAGRVERGARSYFILRAPEGTQFARFTWSGQARRNDCRYALQLWAARPEGVTRTIKNVRANTGCPPQGRIQAAGWPRPHTYDIAGATSIVQRVLCVGSTKTPFCSARGLNFIRTFKAQATVVDVSAPGVTITQDTPFTRGEWVNGTQQVNYGALDNVGVRVVRPVIGGVPYGSTLRPCNYAERVPCTNGTGSIGLDTRDLPEGSQPLAVEAEDAANNLGASSAVTVRVDHTAPGAVPVALEGDGGWRNRNSFNLVWTNPSEGDRAPISAALYRLCQQEQSSCVEDRRAELGIHNLTDVRVPAPGEWNLRIWREDAAANQEPANGSVPVALRYDPEPPELGFQDLHPSDPTLVSALVTDKVSGLSGGQIELSREGSGIYEALETALDGSRLVARIDDARFPSGSYVLRATARDQAANQNSTDRRLDGQPMKITLPLRTPTTVVAGVAKKRPPRKGERRGGPHPDALINRARVQLGAQVELSGRVKARTGGPIVGAEVRITTRSATSPEQLVATLRTDQKGRYTYVTRAMSTSVVRVVHPGTSTTLPSQREVTLLVPANSTIRASPRHLVNGRAVTFTGRLRSLPVPAGGKLVELQVVLSHRWQTFRTVRTTSDGEWSVRYRFRRSCGLLTYRFRARLPAESGYPFEGGRTTAVGVRVRGRPCH
jgi:hypothetical protein